MNTTPKLIRHESPAGPYWYHPDHPDCQDGQVLWEEPDDTRIDRLETELTSAQAEILGLREALGNLIHDCKTHATDINDIRWGYEGDGGTKLSAEQILEVCEAASKALTTPPPPRPGTWAGRTPNAPAARPVP